MDACKCDRCKEYFTPERGNARGFVYVMRKVKDKNICEVTINMTRGTTGHAIDLCEACQDSFNDWWHQIEGGS